LRALCNYPHLFSALIGTLLCLLSAQLLVHYACRLESHYLYSLSKQRDLASLLTSALARAALKKPDILPIVGASEVNLDRFRHQTSLFFKNYPTGFRTYEIFRAGASALTIAMQAAGLGKDLQGRKIVFSYTPTSFEATKAGFGNFRHTFSLMHAYQFVFSSSIKTGTKHDAAIRILQYPRAIAHDPLLGFALRKLTRNSRWNHFLLLAVTPLGRLQTKLFELQEHALIVRRALGTKLFASPPKPSRSLSINWDGLKQSALLEAQKTPSSNEYGVIERVWKRRFSNFAPKEPGSADALYLKRMQASLEWSDFDILLRVLRDMGARPLILGRPIKGVLFDAQGISWHARQVFYKRMNGLVGRYHFALQNFETFDSDRYFDSDDWAHTGPVGWIEIDKALDRFMHE